jgi:hypothetical protein
MKFVLDGPVYPYRRSIAHHFTVESPEIIREDQQISLLKSEDIP